MKASNAGVWLVVYLAHSPQQAELVQQLLREEGFLVSARSNRPGASGVVELCVLASEAEEARKFLLEKGL